MGYCRRWGVAPLMTIASTVSSIHLSLTVTCRHEGYRVPNKGYRVQPPVPDRLKDALSQFGCYPDLTTGDADPQYISEEQRPSVMNQIMTGVQHLRNYSKLDRLRTGLDQARTEKPDSSKWDEVYMFLRTTSMCCELQSLEWDSFPSGQKLWIELEECEEKRLPMLMALPNGMLVVPMFSMEEYLDNYFSRCDVYQSCWFPCPRMGSQREVFEKMTFPVCATGDITKLSALATVALRPYQFAILINPGQRSSKFITYPEMVSLTKEKRLPGKNRALSIVDKDGNCRFDSHLVRCFDTSKMPVNRVEPHQVEALMSRRPPLPPIAQMELHLLLSPFAEIAEVYIRTAERPKWRTYLGASEVLTQIDVVPKQGAKVPVLFMEHLQRWSYMSEFKMDVHVELNNTAPTSTDGHPVMCVYTQEDGRLWRGMCPAREKKPSIAEWIGYHDPIVDEHGRRVYEMNEHYR